MGFKKENVTIVEVAQMAGVSTATVSRTLAKPEKVRATTRDKVIAVINETGWRPNAQAQQIALLLGRYRKGLRS